MGYWGPDVVGACIEEEGWGGEVGEEGGEGEGGGEGYGLDEALFLEEVRWRRDGVEHSGSTFTLSGAKSERDEGDAGGVSGMYGRPALCITGVVGYARSAHDEEGRRECSEIVGHGRYESSNAACAASTAPKSG